MNQQKAFAGSGLSAVEWKIMHMLSSDYELPNLLCFFCLTSAANLGNKKGELP
jgi:hypothetical protein